MLSGGCTLLFLEPYTLGLAWVAQTVYQLVTRWKTETMGLYQAETEFMREVDSRGM